MTSNNEKNAIKIEYEGQTYSVDADKIDGLDDEQIISLLSVGFPGMAGGKIERKEDGSIKIIKRVGTKGSNVLVKLLEACPEDNLSLRIENFNQQPIEELTIAQWEEVYEGWDLEAIEQMLSQRERQIRSLIVRLYYCPTKVRPLI
ncbi:hypothetical protein [Myxosarcina sp. GI1]|uniref:hypothetical protein n=1 Tax=Myxosarcina sp. GI1 TaxID=1541065 RepID=UPI0005608C72|nr:hypothetical protein [Myxosarcina sp. GI1]